MSKSEKTRYAAAEEEEQGFGYCSLRASPTREFSPDFDPLRAEALLVLEDKWVNGTVLHYYFFDQPTDGRNVLLVDGTRQWRTWVTNDEDEKGIVRAAFQQWKDLGIGLEFEEVDDRREAEIRIGFERGDGYWSALGRNVLDIGFNSRTMNFGRNLAQRASGPDTALHEIGHTLGLPHEHQSPNAGIEWNEEAVYAALARPPNGWSRQKTHFNILRKIPADEVQGSSWDKDSIMHYPFGPGLINKPEQFQDGLEPEPNLSPRDRTWIRTFYPPLDDADEQKLEPFDPQFLSIQPGDQLNFVIRPEASRFYTIQTFGESDTVMVLFEEIDGQPRFVMADDDSAQDLNARLRLKLFQGRKYILRVRLYFQGASGETAVMMW